MKARIILPGLPLQILRVCDICLFPSSLFLSLLKKKKILFGIPVPFIFPNAVGGLLWSHLITDFSSLPLGLICLRSRCVCCRSHLQELIAGKSWLTLRATLKRSKRRCTAARSVMSSLSSVPMSVVVSSVGKRMELTRPRSRVSSPCGPVSSALDPALERSAFPGTVLP